MKVPKTLKWWYGMVVSIGMAFMLVFVSIGITLIVNKKPLTPVFAQVGISIVAAIIASRGWMMNDETVLKRVSNLMTILAILILSCLVVLYTVSSFGVTE